jgi:hypothetical protein
MRMIILLCGIMYGGSACAILDVEYVGTVNEIKVYRDHNNADMYYYSPGRILLATNTQGAPEFKFLQMRYSGSAATGDQGEFRFKSILQVAVRFQGINAADLDLLRSTVDANGSADFLPLPIHHVNAFLVYSSIGKPNSGGSVSGQLESGDGNMHDGDQFIWQEKTFTVSLDNATSQLFWEALGNGQTTISFSYEYYALCHLSGNESVLNVSTTDLDADSLRNALIEQVSDSQNSTIEVSEHLVYANSSAITFNPKEYPELLVKVDINESRVPPDFAILEVRCYDFIGQMTEEIYAKSIELEATGMNNSIVSYKTTFYSYGNSNYRSIRFPYAVKMNMPYRYRVIEILEDGSRNYSKWIIQESWTKLIDITGKKN